MTEIGNAQAHTILVEKPEGKRPLARHRCRCECESDIKMNFKDVGCNCMDWIYLAEVRDRRLAVVNMVMNLLVQSNVFSSWAAVSWYGYVS
jgi:hypothetical protein